MINASNNHERNRKDYDHWATDHSSVFIEPVINDHLSWTGFNTYAGSEISIRVSSKIVMNCPSGT